jgi:hypothetical protein
VASLCSVGWFEVKLMVVSVVVGFRCVSVPIVDGCQVISKSRKLAAYSVRLLLMMGM